MDQLQRLLESLSDEEAINIILCYRRYQVVEDYVTKHPDTYKNDMKNVRQFIPKLLEFNGCIYDEEISLYTKCLKKEIERSRDGAMIGFDPTAWEALGQIEELFNVVL